MAAGGEWVVDGAWWKQADQLSVQGVGRGSGLDEGEVRRREVLSCLVGHAPWHLTVSGTQELLKFKIKKKKKSSLNASWMC